MDYFFVPYLHVAWNNLFQVLNGFWLWETLFDDFGQVPVFTIFGNNEGVLSSFVDIENFDDILWRSEQF